ncbi:MAG TPA: hypothetical protein VK622_09725 [Puia sp.]|nr:hypothetical protein [Puia sp.]
MKSKLDQTAMNFPNPDKGYTCECCGAFHKRYYRRLNANMAMALLAVYHYGGDKFVHVEKLMKEKGLPRSGDFPYLCHWKLLEKKVADREDGSSRNGFYKITDYGKLFVRSEITVQQTLIYYKGKAEGFEGKEISIADAIGKKFDFRELLAGGDYKMQSV